MVVSGNCCTMDGSSKHSADTPPLPVARYLHLQLLTAERAWAHAMAMKTAHAALATASDTKGGLHGRSRKHVLSRLDKAARTAEALVPLVAQTAVTGATDTDVLEVRAYAAMLRGAVDFERGAWQPCLTSYAVAHVLYNALASADLKKAAAAAAGKKSDAGRSTGSIDNERTPLYKDLLSETIDPSIRYAAYQLKMPRTLSVPAIARRAFPSSADAGSLTETVDRLDPTILNPAAAAATAAGGDTGGPKTLTWRSREVRIEDARISAAWGALATARQRLAERLSSSSAAGPLLPRDMAAAYDEVLTVSQDAVDATKQAMDDLRGEGVAASDPRMQSLQVTRTAVNYEMISWRIGRNRVLTGAKDGITMDSAPSSRRHAKKAAKDGKARDERNLAPSRQIARLREKVALYDSTLQSIESVKELPGIAADEELSQTLEGTYGYFYALK